jgi:integrase
VLTDIKIRELLKLGNLPAKRREVPDGKVSGLYFVVQPSGAASWVVRYRFFGVPRKFTIGCYPHASLAQARRAAEEARGRIAQGEDPAGGKKAARVAARAEREATEDLIERVVALFIERHARPKLRGWPEKKRLLEKDIVGRWRGKRLSQITKPMILDMLDSIVDRGAPVGANRTLAAFNGMCEWAIRRGIIESNPCKRIPAPSAERPRERVLSDDELRPVWLAAEKIGWPFGQVIKLLILTGARRDEIAGLRWSELDFAARLWRLPAARSKNKRANEVPLSDAALDIIRSLPRLDRSEFLFTTNGRVYVSGFSMAKRHFDKAIGEMRERPIEGWTFHDLRRTVATNLQKLGVRLEVTEAVLGHVSGSRAGVVGIYQRHDWADEKRQALDAWARRLDAIVTGVPTSNVVELASARA